MNEYHMNFREFGYPDEFTLYHEKKFSYGDIEEMMIQTIKEMHWNGIRRTFGNYKNYMIQTFNFLEK